MPTVVDKNGNKKEVNTFIAGNTQLLKKYGYTLLTGTPQVKPERVAKPEEKKSAGPVAEVKPIVKQTQEQEQANKA